MVIANGEALNFIHFRKPDSIAPVIVQMFMIFSAMLICVGLLYVVILVIAITIHHFIYDRDPYKVPEFVKRSVQFSSDSESSSDDEDDDSSEEPADTEAADVAVDGVSTATTDKRDVKQNQATATRKAKALDNFIHQLDLEPH